MHTHTLRDLLDNVEHWDVKQDLPCPLTVTDTSKWVSMHDCLCHWFVSVCVSHVLVRDSVRLLWASAETLGRYPQSAALPPFARNRKGNTKRWHGAVLGLLFRCYKSVWHIWVYIKRRRMWSARPPSAACSVLWHRERQREQENE